MALHDLSQTASPDAELSSRLKTEARRPFSLDKDLMLRAALFKLSIQEHVLFFNIHHIAFAKWSLDILISELGREYGNEISNFKFQISEEEERLQYADYALWQREEGAGGAADLEYWVKHLAGAAAQLELPAEIGRAHV